MGWDAQGYDRQFSFVTDLGAALVDLLAPQPGERVLDLGCGTGHQAAELHREGIDVVGVDSDAAMVARARAEHPGTTYVLADGQRLVAEGALAKPFDAVLSNAALHWMPDQQAVIDGVRSLLRAGGRFVSEQGGAGNVSRLWGAVTAAFDDVGLPEPTHPWTFPTSAEQASRLEAASFRATLVQHFDRPTRLAPGATAATWVEMFGRDVLAPLPADLRADVLTRTDEQAQKAGLRDDEGWWADYVRLRFVAEAL
jgi:SAM-dependent methyltransferase